MYTSVCVCMCECVVYSYPFNEIDYFMKCKIFFMLNKAKIYSMNILFNSSTAKIENIFHH